MRKIDAGMLMIFRQRRPASLQGHKNVHLIIIKQNVISFDVATP